MLKNNKEKSNIYRRFRTTLGLEWFSIPIWDIGMPWVHDRMLYWRKVPDEHRPQETRTTAGVNLQSSVQHLPRQIRGTTKMNLTRTLGRGNRTRDTPRERPPKGYHLITTIGPAEKLLQRLTDDPL